MKTLLQVGIEVNSGSTGRIAEHLGELAMEKGWESYITYARGYNPSKSNVIKVGNKFNIYSHVLQTRLLGNHLLASTKATIKLIKDIQYINPDIIHLHQIHGYYLNVKILFEYLSNCDVPIVWTLHDCWSFTGHCSYFSLLKCEKWKTVCTKCPQYKGYPKSLFFDNSEKNFHLKKEVFTNLKNVTLVTISSWLKNLVEESFMSTHIIRTINNGVDIKQFKPTKNTEVIRNKYTIPNKHVILGVGTTWIESKGLYDYYKLNDQISDDYVIVLVGISESLKNKLPKGIIGIRRTDNINELADLYSLAMVVTSLSYQEAFGLTPVEGFACGTPAIVYNATALPELVSPEVGYIVEAGDIEGILIALEKIKTNGKDYYSDNCRKRAVTNYDSKKKNHEYLSLYDELLTSV
jgi:putative colanic acid biosynthesis glycosyltransferase